MGRAEFGAGGGQQLAVLMDDTDAVTFDEPVISEDHRSVARTEERQVAASYPAIWYGFIDRF